MQISRVCLLGGSGFIGRHVAERLSDLGFEVIVPTRRRERAKFLLVLPTVDVVEADIHDDASLKSLISGCDAVINLVGILHAEKKTGFERAHVKLPQRVAKACVKAGVPRLIHMSALNADTNAPSEYLRSRARGEAAVNEVAKTASGLHVTMFRPSVVFGRGDNFLNLFAQLVKLFPVIPLGSAHAKFQPVHVDDVARAIAASLDKSETFGQTYPLCGPKIYTLRQLVDFVTAAMRKSRIVIELGPGLSMLQAGVLEFLFFWNKFLTRDNVKSMQVDSVCGCDFPAVFGFLPSDMESIVPQYLDGAAPRSRYPMFRNRAGRYAKGP
jgi:NADH dehydrogenase